MTISLIENTKKEALPKLFYETRIILNIKNQTKPDFKTID